MSPPYHQHRTCQHKRCCLGVVTANFFAETSTLFERGDQVPTCCMLRQHNPCCEMLQLADHGHPAKPCPSDSGPPLLPLSLSPINGPTNKQDGNSRAGDSFHRASRGKRFSVFGSGHAMPPRQRPDRFKVVRPPPCRSNPSAFRVGTSTTTATPKGRAWQTWRSWHRPRPAPGHGHPSRRQGRTPERVEPHRAPQRGGQGDRP